MKDFFQKVRVYYKDTDTAGVVYYGRYLEFLEVARSELAREIGFDFNTIEKKYHLVFPVVHVDVDYKKFALLDNLLLIKTNIPKVSDIKINFYSEIYNEQEQLILKANVINVSINKKTFKIQKMPLEFIKQFKKIV